MHATRFLQLATRYNGVAVAVATLAALVLQTRGAFGFAVGSLFAAVNFGATCLLARRSCSPGRHKLAYAIALAVKLAVSMAVLAALAVYLPISPVGLALGLTTFVIAMVCAGAHVYVVGCPSHEG